MKDPVLSSATPLDVRKSYAFPTSLWKNQRLRRPPFDFPMISEQRFILKRPSIPLPSYSKQRFAVADGAVELSD